MPEQERLGDLALDEPTLEQLRPWARLFDTYSRQVPASRPYTAEEFLNWVLQNLHMRSPEQTYLRGVAERRRHAEQREEELLRGPLRVAAGT